MDVFTLVGLPRIYAWHGCLGKCGTSCRCLRGDGNIIKTLRRRKDSVQCRVMVDDSTQRMILLLLLFFFFWIVRWCLGEHRNEWKSRESRQWCKNRSIVIYNFCDPLRFSVLGFLISYLLFVIFVVVVDGNIE